MPRRGGGGRGNKKSHGARFRISNSKKRKSKGASNNHRAPQDFHQLEDFSGLPDVSLGKMSLAKMSKRPGRLMNEVKFTSDNHDKTMMGPLRKRPIEFVKAKEVYDPNEELRKKLEEVKFLPEPEVMEPRQVTDEDKGLDEQPLRNALEEREISTKNEGIEVNEDVQGEVKQKSVEPVEFSIDETGDEDLKVEVRLNPTPGPNVETTSVAIGKVLLKTHYEDGEMVTDLMSQSKLNSLKPGFVNESSYISSSDDFDEDDPLGYQDYMSQMIKQLREDTDEYESDTNFDIMASDTDDEPIPLKASSNKVEKQQEPVSEAKEETPEYGFLEEDYEFDVSKISISNIRYGVKNQYYIVCPELTGTGDSIWIDEDEVVDYILENGVRENRLSSFFKFMTKGLVDNSESEESEVYVSDLEMDDEEESEEEEEEEDMDSDDNDLAQLISFSQNHHFDMNMTMDTETSSLRTKGKGKKKRLDLEKFDMDNELRQSLQDQYQTQREAKKLRKLRKHDQMVEDGLNSNDLLIKYPYTLHIKDIRNEMLAFLHDSLRSTLNFPPLDPHGNKTIGKMADCYNFKSKRVGGNGLKSFMQVVKTKRTFNYLPNEHRAIAITKQRPVFHRVDVQRPKDEYLETDGNKEKDRKRQRGKSSNANVKEGDIVGDKAPEIPSSNIGRQLLEKMGWSKGEGLGLGKRGIHEIIQAKVKTSKLGLK